VLRSGGDGTTNSDFWFGQDQESPQCNDVSLGSWLCENAAALFGSNSNADNFLNPVHFGTSEKAILLALELRGFFRIV
jgi:hypothetical protein